jgi:hypothetical protein
VAEHGSGSGAGGRSGVDARVLTGEQNYSRWRICDHHRGLDARVGPDVDELTVGEHPPAHFTVEPLGGDDMRDRLQRGTCTDDVALRTRGPAVAAGLRARLGGRWMMCRACWPG